MLYTTYPTAIKLTCVLPLFLFVGCKEDKVTSNQAPVSTKKETTVTPKAKPTTTDLTSTGSTLPKDPMPSDKSLASKQEESAIPASTAPVKKATPKPKPRKKVSRPNLKFDLIRHNFDTIVAGDVIDYKFEFTNTGKAPLVIESVRATCGCTQPSYPFVPIEPGETGFIGVTYNSVGKEGLQKPLVTVRSNASKEPIALMLTGFVETKKKEKKEPQDTIK